MNLIFRRTYTATAIFLSLLSTSARAVTVEAPCTDTPGDASGLRSCPVVLSSPTGSVTLLRKRINDYLTTLYATGSDPNALDPTASASFGPTLCNLVPGPFNGVEEFTNRAGKSCGIPYDVKISYSGSTQIHLDPTPGKNLPLEEGYLRGGYVAALACFSTGLSKQIETTKKFIPHASCEALARDVIDLGKSAEDVTLGLKAKLGTQGNISDIMNCITPTATPVPGQTPDVGPLRQSAQQLCAARLALESLFTQLMVCETFARAGNAHKNIMALPSARDEELKLVSEAVTQRLISRCSQASRIPSDPLTTQPGQTEQSITQDLVEKANSCIKQYYRVEFAAEMRRRLEQIWPSNPSSPTECKEVR